MEHKHEGEVELDEAQKWELHGGKRVDKHGNLIDKYDRKYIPKDFYSQYCIDDSQRGGLATHSWLGAVRDPSNPPAFDPSQPDKTLQLEYVYGFRAYDTRQNVWYTATSQEIVYMSAALGVVLNTETNVQRTFGAGEVGTTDGHDDDITAIAIHPDRTLVATGQVGKNPKICVWDTRDSSLQSVFHQGIDTKSVKSLSFSASGKLLYSTGDDDNHTVSAFDWESRKKLAEQEGGADFVVSLRASPKDEQHFAVAGKNGVKIWELSAKGLEVHKGVFGKHAMADMYSLEWLQDGHLITGSLKGNIYVWAGNSCINSFPCHKGSVSALSFRGSTIVTGGLDKMVHFYDKDFKLKKSIEVESVPRSIDQDSEGDIVVGLKDGTVLEIKGGEKIKVHMRSHSEGEVWGLAVCYETGYVLTTGDDNQILVWDPTKRAPIGRGTVNKEAGPKTTGGASTTSSLPSNQCARAIDINRVNGHIAIGINDGEVSIRESVAKLDTVISSHKTAKGWIEVIRYSPDGQLLAVGSHDNDIYIYHVEGYKPLKKLAKHNAFITALDWSEDSKYIHSQCGAYELLFFDVNSGHQITDADALKDEEWAEWTLKLGWPVQGIQPIGVDGTHINGVTRSSDKKLIATGDDWRLVNIFRNPALAKAQPRAYIGHAEHVVRAAFSKDNKYLFSIGGADRTLLQWKVV